MCVKYFYTHAFPPNIFPVKYITCMIYYIILYIIKKKSLLKFIVLLCKHARKIPLSKRTLLFYL